MRFRNAVTMKDEDVEEMNEVFSRRLQDRKIPSLVFVSRNSSASFESRQKASRILAKYSTGQALIATSTFARMLANLYTTVNRPPVPARVFSNEEDARRWISPFLRPTEES